MKAELFSSLLLFAALTACQHGPRGTTGTDIQIGAGRAEGSTPYALGRTDPSQRAGMPDANIAASRAEAGLDVSDSGAAELSRRSATVTVQPMPPAAPENLPPSSMTADENVQGRVRLALSSGSPYQAAAGPSLSIATLNNLQINVHNGAVILSGLVPSVEAKNEIDRIARNVDGVRTVRDEMQIAAPEPAAATVGR